ncbi:MAG: relaxase/mobilization nuclease domain-containing protein, partial [Ruminococcus sp.]|nr:relaxase/mobilization nuclease domain-containing protein [Ruminococcus sp.]
MAIIKAVSSKSPIKTAIAYVSKDEKTEQKLLSGYNLTAPETAYDEMQITKEVWNKTGGRTYKHYVQSFAPDEEITPEQVHAIAKEFVERCPQFKGFEVLIATHQDREHIHTHFILNSVSFEDGHKFQ